MKIGVAGGEGGDRLVAVVEDRAYDLPRAAAAAGVRSAPTLSSLDAFLAAGDEGREAARDALDAAEKAGDGEPVDGLRFVPPVVAGAKILCHVINFSRHGPAGVPRRPFFFYKPQSALVAPGAPIESHREMSKELDFEAELAVVVGRPARDVAPERAYEHVAGYTIVNDVSHREYQFNKMDPDLSARYGMNWTQAKGLDGSCPVGPWIALTDELPVPYPRQIRCWVNGELRQDASTDEMVHKVPALLAEISRGMTLWPGDVVATGTPAGTGLDDGRYLSSGDVVRCQIDGIGTLENPVA